MLLSYAAKRDTFSAVHQSGCNQTWASVSSHMQKRPFLPMCAHCDTTRKLLGGNWERKTSFCLNSVPIKQY